jgi:hypothetical protein
MEVVNALFDKELTIAELMDAVGVASRGHFRENVIQAAMADGYLEMTQPDAPRSPTQRYRLTAKGRAISQATS